MLILDLLIIYLACGSPFAVSRLLKEETYYSLPDVLSSVAVMFYWPFLIPQIIKRVYRQRSNIYSSTEDDVDSRVNELQEKLEQEWCAAFTSERLNVFRDTLLRYIRISLELNVDPASDDNSELLIVAGHTDADVGDACLERRNRKKLELHQTSSRIELIEAIDSLISAGRYRALDLAIQLTEVVGDESGRPELEMLETGQNETAIAA
ncbi:MAG TPA: hypothetical protein VEV84_05310 [Pyrinomonadaceae bacterium]|nr:hypothetical protein [Pyrinomonadaceae bacterium]